MPRPFLSLAVAATILGFSARAYGRFTVIAVDGDAPPRGTGVFAEGLGVPALSNSGQAAFPSNLRDNGFISGFGIFASDGSPGNLETIVLEGDATPDVNGTIGQVNQSPINLNNQDEIAFRVDLDGSLGGATDHTAIYRTDGTGTLTQIAHLGQTVPGDDGKLFSFSPIDLNDAGQAAFYSVLTDTTDNAAIYVGDGGALQEIVRVKRTAPGAQVTFQILDPLRVALNESGAVMFSGTATDGSQQQVQGLFRGDGNATATIAQQGGSVPGGNGTYLLLSALQASLNDDGQVAFTSLLLGTAQGNADNQGVFRGDGNDTITIARKGEFVPDQNGRYLEFSPGLMLNNDGAVLFHATISGASGGSNEGLFIADGTNATAVARLGDSAPGGGRFSDFSTYALNDTGQAAFHANIDLEDGGDANDTFGLFFYDPVDGLIQVARKDQQLKNVGAMGNINFAGASSHPTDALDGINENGQVAFQCFAGEHVAVVVWEVPNTTTTTTTSTTTEATTTTTLDEGPACAQPVTGGGTRFVSAEDALRGQGPTASDCLFILRTAVGSQTCAPVCVCDPTGDHNTTASDALICLKKAVGQFVTLNCPCAGATTTTVEATTTTLGSVTTTTDGGPTK